MLVFWRPPALRRLDRRIEVRDEGRRRVSGLDGGRVHERLERRARLAPGLPGPVEGTGGEVASAHQRPHLAGLWIQRDERGLQRGSGGCRRALAAACRLPRLDLLQRALDLGLSGLLHRQIEGRVHHEAAFVHARVAEPLDQLEADGLLEVLTVRLGPPERVLEHDGLAHRLLVLVGGDDAGVPHDHEHDVSARGGARQVDGRRVGGRRLHQSGQQRRLGQGEVGRRLAEVAQRRRFHPVQAGAEIHLVEVELQDLVLREFRLEATGQHQLLELACVGLFRGQEAVARQLLSQRAGPLSPATLPKVADGCSGHPDQVDALVVVEALVLDGHDGADQMRARRAPSGTSMRCSR